MTTHPVVQSSREPIRLFRSDLLEAFTHVRPWLVAALYGPAALVFLVWAVIQLPSLTAWPVVAGGLVIGLFLWTLAEYLLHRFVFHFRPHTPRQERIAFLVHGVHHAQPMVKTRLVMPPAVSLPLALLFYGLFWLAVGLGLGARGWVAPLFAGFLFGYLAYDMLHYSIHHARRRGRLLAALRRHHLLHHTQVPVSRYGVSTPLWDAIFRTLPT